MLHRLATAILALALAGTAQAYEKATEGEGVVMNKLFPKKSKIELSARFGYVLNSSFVQTYMANGGLTYFFSEEWGLNLDGNFALTSDKPERTCIEQFYNDPNFTVSDECGEANPKEAAGGDEKDANWGPAYMGVRQLKYIFTANMIWNPIYGKQIVLLSATNYFDFFLGFGGGVAMSDYYAQSKKIKDSDKDARGTFQCTEDSKAKGECTDADKAKNPGTDDEKLIGIDGRPTAEQQTNLLIHLSLGQKFHFLKRFMLTAGLENYTLVGTPSGFDNFFTLVGGLGVRF